MDLHGDHVCCITVAVARKQAATYYIIIIIIILFLFYISLPFANRVNRNLHDHCKNITIPSSSSTHINLSLVSLMVCSHSKLPACRRSHRSEELSPPENNVPNTSATPPLTRQRLD